jgi:hypothetical protein
MNKLAIFVEGQTEQIFIEKLVRHLGGHHNMSIQVQRLEGGGKNRPRTITQISGTNEVTNQDYFILIMNCGQDERVKSDIIERYDGLITSGYQVIIGVRDVYPSPRNAIQRLREGLAFRLPTVPIIPLFVLEIMEIEAWFLAEHTHFLHIHPDLTIDRIQQNFGFNPSIEDMQLRDHPSKDLEDIYFLENIYYDKNRECIERTVNFLDFDIIVNQIAMNINDLGSLVKTIQDFFQAPI